MANMKRKIDKERELYRADETKKKRQKVLKKEMVEKIEDMIYLKGKANDEMEEK